MNARLVGVLSILLVAVILSACASATPTPDERVVLVTKEVEKIVERPASLGQPFAQTVRVPEAERRIIYTASLVLVVEDPETAAEEVARVVTNLGGYIATANLYRVNGRVRGTLTLRVPQERFEAALAQLRELAVRVDRETRETEDVTSEYVDLNARLKNLEATEAELRALLSEVRKRSQRASDVLEVYRELTRVREEIERIKGRIQMLEQLTTFATITVELVPYELRQPVGQRWDPRVTLHRAWSTLVQGGQLVIDVLIYGVVVGVPLMFVLGLPLYLIFWAIRYLRRRWTARPS